MSSTTLDAGKAIKIHGHVSATPEMIASLLGGQVSNTVDSDCDLAIFAINPAAGIDSQTIDLWRGYDEYQTPRMVLISVLDGVEMDFDDGVLIANRVFDQLVTPFLVLHGESGTPIGTISLRDLTTCDYSKNPPVIEPADSELIEMVQDFREEYLEQMEGMDETAFAAGIIFPAIPINISNRLGLDIVKRYLDLLPSSS
jgi:hypothetical protein